MKLLLTTLLSVLAVADAVTVGAPKGTTSGLKGANTQQYKLGPKSPARRRRNLKSGSESSSGEGGEGGGCFSRRTTVNVQGQGPVTMDQLNVGDRVQVGDQQYEPVYGFYKRNHESINTFVTIETSESTVELTESHLLFVDGVAKRAAEVNIGDELSGGTVSNISTTAQKGIYSPLTNSGKLVVNDGIVASAYGTVTENSSSMEIAGFEVGINLHSWLHFIQTLHRVVCRVSWESCNNETYDEDGYSRMFFMTPFYKWWMSQNWLVGMLVLVPVVLGLTGLRVVEWALQNMVLTATAAALFVTARSQWKKTSKVVV